MDTRKENFELHEKIATFAEVELVEGKAVVRGDGHVIETHTELDNRPPVGLSRSNKYQISFLQNTRVI
jgi:hypothetical protein